MEIAADAGWDGCTLPARPKCKASTVSDVQKKKSEQKKKLARKIRRRNRPRRRVEQRERRDRLEEAKARSRNSELQVATYFPVCVCISSDARTLFFFASFLLFFPASFFPSPSIILFFSFLFFIASIFLCLILVRTSVM